jgi:two-component system sensor histidine kinase/response regulator
MTKLLVIDDEAHLREAIAAGLRAEGYEVLLADSGAAGTELARREKPDLIVSDINMDGMDGFDTLAALRGDRTTSSIPFVLMTGRADLKSMRHGMSLGADDYLPKPFRMSELLGVVRTRLEKQRALREEADRKLSELRANISMMLPHELLTPLTGVIGMAEMIVNEAGALTPAELREFGEDIKLSGQRLHRLIINFLVYAQLEMMAAQPERVEALRSTAPFEAGATVEKVVRRKAREAGREAELQLSVAAGAATISEQNLAKVCEELVDNALKFSAPGSGVRVSCGAGPKGFELVVADHGRGMKREYLENIGAYVQFDRRIHEQQGSGLGLAIARRLVELHGGRIEIHSEPDFGTTVRVTLPAESPAAAPEPVASSWAEK